MISCILQLSLVRFISVLSFVIKRRQNNISKKYDFPEDLERGFEVTWKNDLIFNIDPLPFSFPGSLVFRHGL